MSRFKSGGAGRASSLPRKEPIPADEADVLTAKSPPPHRLDDLVEVESSRQCIVEVGHATAKNWGGRHENEDRIMYKDFGLSSSSSKDSSLSVPFCTLGILDGHDTEIASDLVSRYLPGVLYKHLSAGSPFVDSYTVSMAEVEDILKTKASTAGTCVLSCAISAGYVWCANLGDCRAAMINLKEAIPSATGKLAPKVSSLIWLSKDQKASTPEERKRIKEAGGVVIDGRVEGLEPSRTLGDFDVKQSVNPGVISIVPEVRRAELSGQAIIVCATDGVWDVMSGQDMCDLVHSRKEIADLQLKIGRDRKPDLKPLHTLAEDMVQFSVAKGSRDDCTAIVSLVSVESLR